MSQWVWTFEHQNSSLLALPSLSIPEDIHRLEYGLGAPDLQPIDGVPQWVWTLNATVGVGF